MRLKILTALHSQTKISYHIGSGKNKFVFKWFSIIRRLFKCRVFTLNGEFNFKIHPLILSGKLEHEEAFSCKNRETIDRKVTVQMSGTDPHR